MKIHIDDTIYEGSAAEIMEQFRLLNEHPEDFPSVEHYVRYIAARFTRTTGLPVALPETCEEEQAHEMLQILAYTNALEILEDASGAENAPEAVLQAENSAVPDRTDAMFPSRGNRYALTRAYSARTSFPVCVVERTGQILKRNNILS